MKILLVFLLATLPAVGQVLMDVADREVVNQSTPFQATVTNHVRTLNKRTGEWESVPKVETVTVWRTTTRVRTDVGDQEEAPDGSVMSRKWGKISRKDASDALYAAGYGPGLIGKIAVGDRQVPRLAAGRVLALAYEARARDGEILSRAELRAALLVWAKSKKGAN